MSQQASLQALSLTNIVRHCSRETEKFFQRVGYDPRYCFELFRRAIEDRSEHAWDYVYRQYRSIVAGWVKRHESFTGSGEEVQYFINRAFEKMWSAMSPEKFGQFPTLKAVLRYLQMCAHSAIIDEVRSSGPATSDIDDGLLPYYDGGDASAAEDDALDNLYKETVWEEVKARLKDDKERTVVYGSYVLALKPSRLYEQYPDTFDDVNDVYRVKENVLARFRRDAGLQHILKTHA